MADYCRTTIFFKGPEPDEREIRALIDSYTTINQDGIAITDFSELTFVLALSGAADKIESAHQDVSLPLVSSACISCCLAASS
jgi:hypothetical protein